MYQVNNGDCTGGSFTITTTGEFTSDTVHWIGDPLGGVRDTGGTKEWKYGQGQWQQQKDYTYDGWYDSVIDEDKLKELMETFNAERWSIETKKTNKKKSQKKGEFYTMKRLVNIMVVDPDKRVADDKSVVYAGKNELTSLTDEDLLMEIDLKKALELHNEVRKNIEDEDRSDKRNKVVYLKPVKVSELEVKVITIAKF